MPVESAIDSYIMGMIEYMQRQLVQPQLIWCEKCREWWLWHRPVRGVRPCCGRNPKHQVREWDEGYAIVALFGGWTPQGFDLAPHPDAVLALQALGQCRP